MIINIVKDATRACITRKDDINLHKLGIKLVTPEYSGGDTLERVVASIIVNNYSALVGIAQCIILRVLNNG